VEIGATADYFRERALRAGRQFNVPEERCFGGATCYQKLLELRCGFNAYRIGFEDISKHLDIGEKFNIAFNPNILEKCDEGLCLYFGVIAFIWDTDDDATNHSAENDDKSVNKRPFIKVVAWDLDNTIWDGVLIEDGAKGIKLKPGILEIIKQLDKRGILNTVVSKNNYSDAFAQLEALGLNDYILHPKIGWGQKGQYLKSLVQHFNVGEDAFAFLDDSPFERDEALAMNPKMRVYDSAVYDTLLKLPEFNPPVSTDSNRRRDFYKYEENRKEAQSSYQGEYLSFLKDCDIQLSIYSPKSSNINRIQELVQRTNQLNFSGNKYGREEIKKILRNSKYEAFSMDCEDKYGQYGTVGFAIVSKHNAQLIDLMLSCRVQAKRVEHAFFSFLLHHYKAKGFEIFSALYKRTDRNCKAGEVFNDMGFEEESLKENVKMYIFALDKPIPNDNVIQILWNGTRC
jgi:FkbH-like protein